MPSPTLPAQHPSNDAQVPELNDSTAPRDAHRLWDDAKLKHRYYPESTGRQLSVRLPESLARPILPRLKRAVTLSLPSRVSAKLRGLKRVEKYYTRLDGGRVLPQYRGLRTVQRGEVEPQSKYQDEMNAMNESGKSQVESSTTDIDDPGMSSAVAVTADRTAGKHASSNKTLSQQVSSPPHGTSKSNTFPTGYVSLRPSFPIPDLPLHLSRKIDKNGMISLVAELLEDTMKVDFAEPLSLHHHFYALQNEHLTSSLALQTRLAITVRHHKLVQTHGTGIDIDASFALDLRDRLCDLLSTVQHVLGRIHPKDIRRILSNPDFVVAVRDAWFVGLMLRYFCPSRENMEFFGTEDEDYKVFLEREGRDARVLAGLVPRVLGSEGTFEAPRVCKVFRAEADKLCGLSVGIWVEDCVQRVEREIEEGVEVGRAS